jgi:hypothetical protein
MEMAHLGINFYNNITMKNWSTNYIKEGLVISNTKYSNIYSTLEKEMETIALLSCRLNTTKHKAKMQIAFTNL